MPLIFFFCPDCREELEAEEAIRGMKMKCPACYKEIEVPQAGVKVSTRSQKKDKEAEGKGAATEPIGKTGSKFVGGMLLAGVIGLGAIMGVGYALQKKAKEDAERRRPDCPACEKGKIRCAQCGGAKSLDCKDCEAGKRKNTKNEEETCQTCSGRGVNSCRACDGAGEYDCTGCAGKGKLDPPAGP